MEQSTGGNRKNEKVYRSVVKLFVQISTPNYSMPWQMKRQQQIFGSGFVISGRRILTNGHVVAYQKSVRVRKHGDAKKYNAHVIHVGHECDIALVGVDDDEFWKDLEPLEFGDVPELETDILCVGFPTGGDNISVTRGVVSRVDIQRYSHSAVELLVIQIDAAINSGNSGGPALQGDKVIGIAFETLDNAENIGYIIPIPVIKHFLEDIRKNNMYMGFCRLGIKYQPIESSHMRNYFKLCPGQTGILISRVFKLFCSDGILQRGDILLSIEGQTIADNGTLPFRRNERILFNFCLLNKYVGDVCGVQVLRCGKVLNLEVKLNLFTSLVPTQLYDKRPSYIVFAGLVFVALSQPFMLHQYGKDWARKAPIRLCDRVMYGLLEKAEQEVVILSQVLSSELTSGYDSMANLQLFKVNGIPILNLKHLSQVLDSIIETFLSNQNTEELVEVSVPVETTNSATLAVQSVPSLHDTYTSFGNLEEGLQSPISVSQTTDDLRTGYKDHAHPCSGQSIPPRLSGDRASGIQMGLEEDQTLLLLNTKEYIHFELDKDKLITMHILSAVQHAPAVLKEHAIAQSRSDDLLPSIPADDFIMEQELVNP